MMSLPKEHENIFSTRWQQAVKTGIILCVVQSNLSFDIVKKAFMVNDYDQFGGHGSSD